MIVGKSQPNTHFPLFILKLRCSCLNWFIRRACLRAPNIIISVLPLSMASAVFSPSFIYSNLVAGKIQHLS